MFTNKKSHQKKRRRDSYEYLCGNRFSNSKTYDSENSSLFTNDDDDSNEPIDEARNAITGLTLKPWVTKQNIKFEIFFRYVVIC